jgi:hypothetical protein
MLIIIIKNYCLNGVCRGPKFYSQGSLIHFMIGEKDALELHVTTCEPGGEIVGLIVGVVLLEFDGEE